MKTNLRTPYLSPTWKKRPYIKDIIFLFLMTVGVLPQAFGQTIMFDDFTYSSNNDAQLSSFNKWYIVNGTSGPPEGAMYSRNNVNFINDPANAANRLMTLSTTVNGTTKATTHSRIETAGYEYFEGTYAARVYFTDNPFVYKDGNVQTFYTITGSNLSGDGSRYSELDFEYLASDVWGVAPEKQVLYLTSWNRYIANPWQAWKRYFSSTKSWEGWHTCVVSCTNKRDVKYWVDGVYFGSMATTDNDGSSVYPRNPMMVAFANWIWNNVTGSSTANRTTTMQVDWTLFYKDTEVLPAAVDNLVASFKSQGIQRRNLAGQTFVSGGGNQSPSVQVTGPANNSSFNAPATINITANASDADGSVSKVDFYNGGTFLGSDNTAPYTFSWANVGAGTYAITARATDNLNAVTTSATVNVTVIATVVQSPYGGTPWVIPGTIEAENYDLGGQNVAFNELAATNEGGAYRTDAVDIEITTGGGYNLGYILNGEWLEYTVNVTTAGTYKIDARVATTAVGKTFRVELDGASLTTFTLPNTTGWQIWQTVTSPNVTLTAGQKVLRIFATSTDFNLDKLVFTRVVSNQLPSVGLTSPANNASFTAPATVSIAANASDADGTISKVDFYQGSTLLGSDNTAPYTFNWSNVAAGTYSLTARATDNANGVSTSTAVNITVTTPNSPPTVNISSPANNASFTSPATVSISANATDADGAVSKVDFYQGSTLLGSDNTAPYTFSWTNVATGNYSITARATDNAGAVTTSTAVNITVSAPSTQSPYLGTAWAIPGTIEAENYDLGGQGIAFNESTTPNEGAAYRTDAVDIEAVSGGGYNVGWIAANEWLEYTVNVSAGTYKIDARVAATTEGRTFRVELEGATIANFNVPNTGGWQNWQTISSPNVTLTSGQKILRIFATSAEFNIDKIVFSSVVNNQLPSVALTSPSGNAVYTAPANISLAANATDNDGTISKVDFYNGATLLGSDNTAPYSFTWSNVPNGNYTVTARATDNAGGVSTSASVSIVVSNPSGQSPYGGLAWAIPGTIQAENYDLGGSFIAFNDVTAANEGAAYRTDAVDVEPTNDGGAGFNVGYVKAGEWLEYTVNIATAGSYKIDARVAAITVGKSFHIEMDGINVSGPITVPNTAGWHIWATVSVNTTSLTAGQKIMRIVFDTDDLNLNYVTFTPVAQAASVETATISNSPNPFSNYTLIDISVAEAGEASIKVADKTGLIVRSIFEGQLSSGTHQFVLDLTGLQADVYFVQMQTKSGSVVRRISKTE